MKIGATQIRLLEKLCNAVAVSGDEAEVRRIVREEVAASVDELRVDAIGNLLAIKHRKKTGRLRILLAAHMDEVGLMVVGKEAPGLYQIEKVGNIGTRYLAGKQVVAGKEHRPGVIGAPPIHLTKSEDLKKNLDVNSLRIDMGKGELLNVGDRVSFATRFRKTGPSIMAKSIDDRIGVAILVETIKHAPSHIEVCGAFTVQEEIGLRGAGVAAHSFHPDIAFVLDATPANDLPSQNQRDNQSYNTILGDGPAIYVADNYTIYQSGFIEFMKHIADRSGIPYQLRQPGGGGTDAGAIHQVLAGVPTLTISVPHRYPHSPMSISRVSDWENTLNLIQAALKLVTLAAIR